MINGIVLEARLAHVVLAFVPVRHVDGGDGFGSHPGKIEVVGGSYALLRMPGELG